MERFGGLALGAGVAVLASLGTAAWAGPDAASGDRPSKAPKIVLISLDGAQPDFIRRYLDRGVLSSRSGLGRLSREGVVARQNVPANPSLSAVSHIAIATGSTAVHNDIPGNSFHPVAGAISASLSGFAAPIGGYRVAPTGPAEDPTAEPLWVRLRKAGKTVMAATWPGADGATIAVNGATVQTADPTRVVDYTVPFGAFGGFGAVGFSLTGNDFVVDPAIAAQLRAAGRTSFSPVRETQTPVETFNCAAAQTASCSPTAPLGVTYAIHAAAIDGTPATSTLSTPSFYGAHGHDTRLPEMSATFIAAGPGIRRSSRIRKVESVDIAPTISRMLGVKPADTVDGDALKEIFRR